MKWLDKLFGIERLNLGEPCEWKDIKVGEVFGVSGCFNIRLKINKNTYTHLADDWVGFEKFSFVETVVGDKVEVPFWNLEGDDYCKVYKLPKKTQELWLP